MSEFPLLAGIDSPDFMADPHAFFRDVHEAEGLGVWVNPTEDGLVVTSHGLLKTLARHPSMQAVNRSSRKKGPSPRGDLEALFDHHPVFMNEPEHMPIHRIAYQAVSWPDAKSITANVRAHCDDLLNDLLEQRQFDLVADYCIPLASRVWGDTLGISAAAASELATHATLIGNMLKFGVTDQERQSANDGARLIAEMIAGALQQNGRLTPVQQAMSDGYAALEHPDPVSETLALLSAMTFDAIDGAAGMTANLFACLALHADAMVRIREDHSMIARAWVEATRWAPSILGLFRSPTEDVEIMGTRFEAGMNVLLLYAAGNVDPEAVENPESFDIERAGAMPLSFGAGGRGCVGRLLARQQGEQAVRCLLQRTHDLTFGLDSLAWSEPGLLRSCQRLPVAVTPARSDSSA